MYNTNMATKREREELKELRRIVNGAATELNCKVFLFGSRADGTSRRTSDYDIGIKGLDPQRFRKLKRNILDYHEASRILVSLDIVDFDTADKEFLSAAMKDAIEWQIN